MNIEEASQALGISVETANSWWSYARAWLFQEYPSLRRLGLRVKCICDSRPMTQNDAFGSGPFSPQRAISLGMGASLADPGAVKPSAYFTPRPGFLFESAIRLSHVQRLFL